MGQSGAAGQWKTAGGVAVALTRIFIIDNGTEYEFSRTGPDVATLALNVVTDEYELDLLGTAIMATNAAGDFITIGG